MMSNRIKVGWFDVCIVVSYFCCFVFVFKWRAHTHIRTHTRTYTLSLTYLCTNSFLIFPLLHTFKKYLNISEFFTASILWAFNCILFYQESGRTRRVWSVSVVFSFHKKVYPLIHTHTHTHTHQDEKLIYKCTHIMQHHFLKNDAIDHHFVLPDYSSDQSANVFTAWIFCKQIWPLYDQRIGKRVEQLCREGQRFHPTYTLHIDNPCICKAKHLKQQT